MGGNTVPVYLPLLWTRPSTSDIYKINESPYFSTAAPKHSLNNIPGRHVDNGQVSTGIDLSSRHCDLPPAQSGICTEFKEVSSGTISENRIFGNGYRLNEDGNLIASREACKTNVTMQTSSREQRDYHHRLNKVNRETAPLQVRYLQRLQIQALKLSKCYHAKVHLDKDSKDELFWWIENLRLCNGKFLILSPADLCISTDAPTKGWRGGYMSRDINRPIMVTGRTEGSHQHTKAESSAFSHIDFYKIPNSSEDTCPDEQQNSFQLPGKDGGALATRTFLVFPNKYRIICSQKRSQSLQSTYQVI